MSRRNLIGLAHRLAYAAALAFFVVDFAIRPLEIPWPASMVLGIVLAALNLPVAIVGLALPCEQRGLDFPVGHCHWLSPQIFLHHLRVAIPVYVLLFYVPNLIKGGIGFLRKRSVRQEAQAGASSEAAGQART